MQMWTLGGDNVDDHLMSMPVINTHLVSTQANMSATANGLGGAFTAVAEGNGNIYMDLDHLGDGVGGADYDVVMTADMSPRIKLKSSKFEMKQSLKAQTGGHIKVHSHIADVVFVLISCFVGNLGKRREHRLCCHAGYRFSNILA
jgi:hypothetical protein